MIPGTPPRDYAIEAETAAEHLKNALQVMDLDARVGFWERRSAYAAVRRRIVAALDLLEARTP